MYTAVITLFSGDEIYKSFYKYEEALNYIKEYRREKGDKVKDTYIREPWE